jgi:hypothetical protein
MEITLPVSGKQITLGPAQFNTDWLSEEDRNALLEGIQKVLKEENEYV